MGSPKQRIPGAKDRGETEGGDLSKNTSRYL